VRLYVEGGPVGADAEGVRRFRTALKRHFERLDPRLKALELVARGSTDQTIKSYAEGVRQHSGDCRVALLVDSDAAVTASSPAQHLASKLDSANVPRDARANIFLMVQCMESWLVTDASAFVKCYGTKTRAPKLPQNPDIEAVPKRDVLEALESMAKSTPNGHYHKIRDGARILAELRPEVVAKRSKHARSLHEFLCQAACS
jgi:hypothetical protein